MYEVPAVEWTLERQKQFFSRYLRHFWTPSVKPFDKIHNDVIQKEFSKSIKMEQGTIGFLARNRDDIYRMCIAYLMSLKKRVFWNSFDLAALLTTSLKNENVIAEVNEYEFAILMYHGSGNKYLPVIADNIISSRELIGFNTFVVSTVDTDLGVSLTDPFRELDGHFVFPKVEWDMEKEKVSSKKNSNSLLNCK